MKTPLQNAACYVPAAISSPRRDSARGWSRWLPIALVVLGVSPAALAQTLVYQGLTNSPLGGATLAVSGNQLTVGNLGGSGQDGVSITSDPQCMWNTVEILALDSSNALPMGAWVRSQTIGTANGITDGVLGTLTETKIGTSNYVISADYLPLGAGTYTVQVYYHGMLMAQSTNQSGARFASVNIMGRGKDVGDIITPLSDETGEGPPGVLTLAGGTTSVPYDRLVVMPDNVTGSIVPSAFQIVASQVPSITITSENESMLYQGLTNTSLGNASIAVKTEGDGVKLALAGIGAGGRDGVSIALPGYLTALDLGWDDLDPSNALPVGAYFQSQIVGTDNGVTNGILGTMTEAKSGTSNYVISADFSAVGVSAFTVQAYYQGVLVAQATNQNGGSLAVARDMGVTTDTLLVNGIPGPSSDWGAGTTLLVAGRMVTCDHLEIRPENMPLPAAVTAFQIVASQIPVITINSENESLVYDGFTNTSLGDASVFKQDFGEVRPQKHSLTLAGLGTNGQDGVSISCDSDPECQWDAGLAFQPLDSSNTLPVGAYLQAQAVGIGNGITNGVLGTLTETKAGTSNYWISADYSPLGAKSYTVQAYYQGTLTAQATSQSGQVFATVNIMGQGKDMGDIITPLSDEWPDGEGVILTIQGLAGVPCDHLVVTPENVTTPVISTAFQMVAAQIPAITITNEMLNVIYQGQDNTALGDATLDVSSNQLTVSSLGGSGQDGVSIEDTRNISDGAAKGQASDREIHLDPPDAGNTLPVGAWMQAQLIGTGGGITNGVLGTLTLTKECADCGGSNWLMSVDFSPMGASNYVIEATMGKVPPPPRDGNLMENLAFNLGKVSVALADTGDFPQSFGYNFDPLSGEFSVSMGFEPYGAVSADGTNVVCDHLYVTPQNVFLPFAPTGLQLVASRIPGFTINRENETVPYAGLYFTTLGNATLTMADGEVTVSNLGSTGQDGVSVEDTRNLADGAALGQASDMEIRMNPPDNGGALPVGAYLAEQLIGTGNGVTNDILGTLILRKVAGGNYGITADFSPIGQNSYGVDETSNTIQLESFQWGAANGIIAQTTNFPPYLGLAYENTSNSPSLLLDWSTNSASLSGNGTQVVCNHLTVTPDNVSLPGPPTGLQIVASQVPSFTLNTVAVSPLFVYRWWVNRKMKAFWYGAAGLQESTGLMTWTDATNATSPYDVSPPNPNAPAKFYRLVFRP